MTKTLYVLVTDGTRAKLYRAQSPVLAVELVYEQLNFAPVGRESGHPRDYTSFTRGLCALLRNEVLAGNYSGLVLIGSPEVLDALRAQLCQECLDALLYSLPRHPAHLTQEELVAQLQALT